MKLNSRLLPVLLAGVIFGGIGYLFWQRAPMGPAPLQERKVLLYQDSMHPWIKSDQPGKCTIWAMDLTPIYEGEKGFGLGENMVVLNSNSITVLNVQTEEVKRQPLDRLLRVAGILEANETRKTILSAPALGRVEDLAVDYAGVEVKEGQRLFTFYSPELSLKRHFVLPSRLPGQTTPLPGAAQRDPQKPRMAILFPGGSAYAYVDQGDGAYERRRVRLGRQGGETWEVLHGLEEGERVVTAGNVLIDAQAQFNQGSKPDGAAPNEMASAEMESAEPEGGLAEVEGDMHPSATDAAAHEMTVPVGEEVQASANPLHAAPANEMAPVAVDSTNNVPGPTGAQASPNVVRARRDVSEARMALRDQMRVMRLDAFAQASQQKMAEAHPPTAHQPQAILGAGHRWSALIQPIVAIKWLLATDLAGARKQFLPFSTAMVALAKRLRKEDPAWRGLKIYHCPMAPKPGLWMQAKGPIRNPFYGSKMLTCGEEVSE